MAVSQDHAKQIHVPTGVEVSPSPDPLEDNNALRCVQKWNLELSRIVAVVDERRPVGG